MKSVVKIYASSEPVWNREIGLYFYEARGEKLFTSDNIVFRECKKEDETCYRSPTIRIKQEEAQQLMDELWRVGLRPSEGSGSAGAMTAVQKHLEDMRTLVFKQ